MAGFANPQQRSAPKLGDVLYDNDLSPIVLGFAGHEDRLSLRLTCHAIRRAVDKQAARLHIRDYASSGKPLPPDEWLGAAQRLLCKGCTPAALSLDLRFCAPQEQRRAVVQLLAAAAGAATSSGGASAPAAAETAATRGSQDCWGQSDPPQPCAPGVPGGRVVAPQPTVPRQPPTPLPLPAPSQLALPRQPTGGGAFAATSRLGISAKLLCGGAAAGGGGGGGGGGSASGGGAGGGDVAGALAAAMPALTQLHLSLSPGPGAAGASGAAAAAAAGMAQGSGAAAAAAAVGGAVAAVTLAALPVALRALLIRTHTGSSAAPQLHTSLPHPAPLPTSTSLARGLTHLTISLTGHAAADSSTSASHVGPSPPPPPSSLLPLTAPLAAALAAGAACLVELHLPALSLDTSAPDSAAAVAARHLAALTQLTSLSLGDVRPAYSLLHDLLPPPPLLPAAPPVAAGMGAVALGSSAAATASAATAATATAATAAAAAATARPLAHLDLGAASGPLPARPLSALLRLQVLHAPRAELTAAGVGPLTRLHTLRVGSCKPEALAPALRPLVALAVLDVGEAPGPLALAPLAAAVGAGGGVAVGGAGEGLHELWARSATVTLLPPAPRPTPLAAVWQQQQQSVAPALPGGPVGGAIIGPGAAPPPPALPQPRPLPLPEPQLRARLAWLRVLVVGSVEVELLPALLQLLPALTSLDLGDTRGVVPAAALAPCPALRRLHMPRAHLVARGAPLPPPAAAAAAAQPAQSAPRFGGGGDGHGHGHGGAIRAGWGQENTCPQPQLRTGLHKDKGRAPQQQQPHQQAYLDPHRHVHVHLHPHPPLHNECNALAHLPHLQSLTLASCSRELLQPMLGPLSALTYLCIAACYSRAPRQVQPAALALLPALAELRLLPHAALAAEGLGGLAAVTCLEVGQLVASAPVAPPASITTVAAASAALGTGPQLPQAAYPLPPRLERLCLTGGQLPELEVLGRLQPPASLREVAVAPADTDDYAAGVAAGGADAAYRIDICPLRHTASSSSNVGGDVSHAAAAASSSSRQPLPAGPHLTAEGEALLVAAARLLLYSTVPPPPYCPTLHVAYGGGTAPAAADPDRPEADRSRQLLLLSPAEGQAGQAARGHGRWLGALGGVPWLRRLQLSGLRLGWRDVEVVATSLPELESLALLSPCAYPLTALPLLGRRRRLHTLRLDTSCWLGPSPGPGVSSPAAVQLSVPAAPAAASCGADAAAGAAQASAAAAAAAQCAYVCGQAVAALVALRTAGGAVGAGGHLELLLPPPAPVQAPAHEAAAAGGWLAAAPAAGGWAGLRQLAWQVAAEVEQVLLEAGWELDAACVACR
ncbi:hypothetical protein HXX76_009714 [Chlamydomonas incerta]|uniref:Uncharacterized protein n=1 Tax=Chlamydomonas incerta TaxID=51695 RepID=A0A835VZZ9_CHLIN|nr:hypothetical protein HXX76_009714 [Chlamydomonas incerta]|eukprot:KAG2431186.1 hypothetical protein HXX76_009714 [Chlamydomonas incerta]